MGEVAREAVLRKLILDQHLKKMMFPVSGWRKKFQVKNSKCKGLNGKEVSMTEVDKKMN
jgi:hypothetical protein